MSILVQSLKSPARSLSGWWPLAHRQRAAVISGPDPAACQPTLIRYLVFLTIALNIILVVAILGYFGPGRRAFAFIAAAGIAIGAA
jgi:hypothetical protein